MFAVAHVFYHDHAFGLLSIEASSAVTTMSGAAMEIYSRYKAENASSQTDGETLIAMSMNSPRAEPAAWIISCLMKFTLPPQLFAFLPLEGTRRSFLSRAQQV